MVAAPVFLAASAPLSASPHPPGCCLYTLAFRQSPRLVGPSGCFSALLLFLCAVRVGYTTADGEAEATTDGDGEFANGVVNGVANVIDGALADATVCGADCALVSDDCGGDPGLALAACESAGHHCSRLLAHCCPNGQI